MHNDPDEMDELLRTLDHAPPAIRAEDIIARSRQRPIGQWRWAAGALIAFSVAGAAWAMPGSPLRGWLAGLGRAATETPAPAAVEPEVVAPTPESTTGIAVAPGRSLRIEFTSTGPEDEAVISLTGEAEVIVTAPVGKATFTTADERLLVASRGESATFTIRIPRDAPRVEILVDGDRRFLKTGARLSPSPLGDEAVRVDLAPRRISPR